MDSEGLLLFTNDGDFANRMMHPRHEVSKTYQVFVTNFSQAAFDRVGEPITLDGYQIRKPTVELLANNGKSAELLIKIHEGRNRQIRRMCAAAGMKVTRLVRVQEGELRLDDLKSGKWRYLTPEEVRKLSD